jgi:predicted SnoaL-like aldol condensation-catalyzing enzyme
MRTLVFTLLVATAITACGKEDKKTETKNKEKMELTKKEKALAVLKSIETGDPKAIAYISQEKYIQHNQAVADGLEGFGAAMGVLAELAANDPSMAPKSYTVRVFEDGDFVFAHTEYNFFGPKIGIDIFRFENGLIVEHWDNLQEIAEETASGRTQIDGSIELNDLDKTALNKALIKGFVADVLMGGNPNAITNYISTEKYYQHNPNVKDGLAGLGEAMTALSEAGMPMVYGKNHLIIGEGNFVLSVSEGIFMKDKVAFYDIFRIENGLIVEHWDTIEKILPEEEAKNTNGKFNF